MLIAPKRLKIKLLGTEGYQDVSVNFSTEKLSFKTNKANPKLEITKIVQALEPDVNVLEAKEKKEKKEMQRGNYDIIRLMIGVLIYFLGMYLNLGKIENIIILSISIIVLLSKTAKKALVQIFKNKVLDENTLITISVIGACLVDKAMEVVMVIV